MLFSGEFFPVSGSYPGWITWFVILEQQVPKFQSLAGFDIDFIVQINVYGAVVGAFQRRLNVAVLDPFQ